MGSIRKPRVIAVSAIVCRLAAWSHLATVPDADWYGPEDGEPLGVDPL